MHWLAFDIGGANLKRADGLGFAVSTPFELWKHYRHLADELQKLVAASPACDRIAVTMTGELADCFPSKTEGVLSILDKVVEAAAGRETRVYLSDGRMTSVAIARQTPLLAAASNWHALARYSGRCFAPRGTGLMIDIGSTTCDVIPLFNGEPAGEGYFDTERLMAGELIYTGVQRSPVCAILEAVPYRGSSCPLAQEFFATSYDAYVTLGHVAEDHDDVGTADGRAATKPAARTRLGRMLCADETHFNDRDAVVVAQAIYDAQVKKITESVVRVLDRLPSKVANVIVSGQGEFLAERVVRDMKLKADIISLAARLGPAASKCAAAHAIASLAREGAS